MINLFLLIYFLFSTLIYSSDFDCLESWYDAKKISQIDNEIINFKGSILINGDSTRNINLFINRLLEKVRIDYNETILILNRNESIKIFKNTNQLFIDKPDTVLHNVIFSVLAEKYQYINKDYISFLNNKYLISDPSNLSKIEIVYDNDCNNIKYIEFKSDQINIYIDQISIEIIQNDNFFKFKDDYFKYDLRYEN